MYVKQGPWGQGDPLSADQVTAMDQGIYGASLGAGVGSNLIGDPHLSDADSQATLWTADVGWSFAAGVWTGTNPSAAGTALTYAAVLPVIESQVYRARVEIDLSGNSATGTVSVAIDWRDASGSHVSTATPISMSNADAPKAFYEGWAVVPSGVTSGVLSVEIGATVPSGDSVKVTQLELVTIPKPVVITLGTSDTVPSTLPAGSLIVRV